MKRTNNLWHKITSIENIEQAHIAASKGKANYKEVLLFNKDKQANLEKIKELLLSKQFTTSKYKVSEIFDGKKLRTIHNLPYFPDRVVHHSLMLVVNNILQKSLIRDTFQSIKHRGTSDAANRVEKSIRTNRPKYALKLDIRKYYPSVDNHKLKQKLRTKIKCKDTLWLLDNIIDSCKGLPIGNYTSQILGNFYLSDLDWLIKQQIKPIGYFRYCDDLLLLSNSKTFLRQANSTITKFLKQTNLELKPSTQVYNLDKQPVDFVGFLFYHDKTRLRTSIKQNFVAACRNKHRPLGALCAYNGWIKRCNARRLWVKHLGILGNNK